METIFDGVSQETWEAVLDEPWRSSQASVIMSEGYCPGELMVIFDIATAFVVGGAIGVRAKGQGRDLALVAASLGVGAPGLIFLDAFPDWDWQYLLDPAALPAGVPGMLLTAIIVMALLGHRLCSASPKTLWAGLAVFLAYTAFSVPRIPYVGTRAQYLAGEAPMFPSDFITLLACVVPLAVAVLAYCLVKAGQLGSEETAG